jgi:DNA adenine methylase
MYNNILKYFPKKYDLYIEPFGGAYSVGLKQKCRNEIYNDLNKNVYAVFKVLSDRNLFNQFKHECDLVHYSEDLRLEFKERLKKDNNLSLVKRAFYFFYVSRSSMNGIGGFSMNVIIRRNMSKSVSDMLSVIDNLEQFHQRLSSIIVCNKNGIELINKYAEHDGVFFYCDPPYVWDTRTKCRYEKDMDNINQIKFINTILNYKNTKFLISGYKNKLYKRLEDNGFKRADFKSPSVKKNGSNFIESLWYNYIPVIKEVDLEKNRVW